MVDKPKIRFLLCQDISFPQDLVKITLPVSHFFELVLKNTGEGGRPHNVLTRINTYTAEMVSPEIGIIAEFYFLSSTALYKAVFVIETSEVRDELERVLVLLEKNYPNLEFGAKQ